MLAEAFTFNVEDVLPKQKRVAELFLGRLQPPHNGHAKIIGGMRNGWVAIVKGSVSSKNKTQNPLPFEYQKKLVNEIEPNVPVIEVPTGYLPDIANEIRKRGQEVQTVFAGADRIEDYQRQIVGVNEKLNADKRFDIKFKLADRVTSATVVRDAIRDGNQTAFRANVPRAIWGEYNKLREYLKESVGMKTFQEFVDGALLAPITEDGEGVANVSMGLASYESPIDSEPPTAKKKTDELRAIMTRGF